MVDDGTDDPQAPTRRTPGPGDRTVPTPPPAPTTADRTAPTPPPPPRAEAAGPPAGPPADQDGGPDQNGGPDRGPGGWPDQDGGPDGWQPAPDTVATPAGMPGSPPGRAPGGDRGVGRRHRRQTWTFVAAFGGVLLLGLLAFAVFQGTLTLPFGGGPTASPSVCTTPPSTIQAAASTRVRVLNASTRRGLALTTARELQKRGFKVPEPPGNDAQPAKAALAAVVRHGPGGVVAARTVATQVKGAVGDEQDDRLGETVDLVLGQTFALVDPATGAAALKNRPGPSPSCTAAP